MSHSRSIASLLQHSATATDEFQASEPRASAVPNSDNDKEPSASNSKTNQRVTHHQTQLVANGLKKLTDRKVEEALRIIVNNVPGLSVCQRFGSSFPVNMT